MDNHRHHHLRCLESFEVVAIYMIVMFDEVSYEENTIVVKPSSLSTRIRIERSVRIPIN